MKIDYLSHEPPDFTDANLSSAQAKDTALGRPRALVEAIAPGSTGVKPRTAQRFEQRVT